MKLLLKNKKYIMTALSFGICFSNCWSILSIIDLFLKKENISSVIFILNSFHLKILFLLFKFICGLLGLMLIVAGLISSFAATIFLKYVPESRKYFDTIAKTLFAITLAALIIISIIIPIGNHLSIVIVGLMMLGAGSLGLQPFECEALEEISFPVQESISINGMFFFASSFGFPLSFISTLDSKFMK